MIGVISKPDETSVVEEFFQLFKTPWEFLQPGRAYDVVLSTTGETPAVDAKVFVVYSSEKRRGETFHFSSAGGAIERRGGAVPIYGRLSSFSFPIGEVLAKTPAGEPLGVKFEAGDACRCRFGYDLFREIGALLNAGQPVASAHVPTLEVHIAVLREAILKAGVPLLEIPPTPPGRDFIVCLTHDIDFVGIRRHKFDHTMWGFLYRATAGSLANFLRGKCTLRRLLRNWRSAASLPLVYVGWAKDFWMLFDWYLQVEKGIPATYFLIPFKHRQGEKVPSTQAKRRASPYGIADIPGLTRTWQESGCEIGTHGIDAWHSVEKGREELAITAAATRQPNPGIRMHWLLNDPSTCRVLDQTGFSYDSTSGYNDTIGYRCGTTQVFRPLGCRSLLELPMHIQDGALFFPQKLNLSEDRAWDRCQEIIDNARNFGGVLTVLWHDRSAGPERNWGDFYERVVGELRSSNVWFASGAQAVDWFRKRRAVVFGSKGLALQSGWSSGDAKTVPPLTLRVHFAGAERTVDVSWTGERDVELNELFEQSSGFPAQTSALPCEIGTSAFLE